MRQWASVFGTCLNRFKRRFLFPQHPTVQGLILSHLVALDFKLSHWCQLRLWSCAGILRAQSPWIMKYYELCRQMMNETNKHSVGRTVICTRMMRTSRWHLLPMGGLHGPFLGSGTRCKLLLRVEKKQHPETTQKNGRQYSLVYIYIYCNHTYI